MVNADGFDVDEVDADDCKEQSIKKKETEKTYCRQMWMHGEHGWEWWRSQ